MSRLAQGGLIDRDRPLRFTFDGCEYGGYAGDTLASALLANDVALVARSFKYHRPRGILTAGSEEPSALVTLRSGARAEPNTRATTAELYDGLEARSQNRWPSLRRDAMAINGLFAPLLVAGFYYKTFMWPAAFWERLYEPLIRRAAGLGALSGLPDPDGYDHDHGFCDLLVIGAGPAGLSAALTAVRGGARVFLVDEDCRSGGRLLAEAHEVDGLPGALWADAAIAELSANPRVTILPRTVVFGAYDGGVYGALERVSDHLPQPLAGQPRQRFWKIVARRAILAAGAVERPLVFAGNDRPGVMMASAVQAYVRRWGVAPGRRVVCFTTCDSGWQAVRDLLDTGVEVAAIVEARAEVSPAVRAMAGAVPVFMGAQVIATKGRRRLKTVIVRDAQGRVQKLAADVLAMAGGWNPSMGIGCNLGARPVWVEGLGAFALRDPPPGMALAGAADGRFSLGAALASGVAAAADFGAIAVPRASDDAADGRPLWHVPHRRGKAFVDYQHDVTDADVALAAREGFTSVEHMKRYTTLGMATDQGKAGQVNGNALLAMATGRTMAEAGTILSRPPWLPVAIGALAGHHRDAHFRPERLTAGHDFAAECGARFTDAGQWKRAQWFSRPGEADWLETVCREVTTTRSAAGICDVSTLGKIDLHGPDAGALLDRLYINGFSKLAVGKARYGLMLREDGIALDDGTVTHISEDHYFLTTTTANAARVMQHIDFARQVIWPGLDVQAISVTEQWATYAVAGPLSRDLLSSALPDHDLSNEALPYMGSCAVRWKGVTARLFRLSFSGELGFELSVPAQHGDALLRALVQAGQAFGATLYGTEALGVMRIEKGHPAGNELNGQTTATDLGLGRMMSTRKDFIGRAMAQRPGLADPARPRLVGLKPVDRTARLRAGAHLLPQGARQVAANDEGYVTSVAFSPTLGHWIALGFLTSGESRRGERVVHHDPLRGGDTLVEVCDPVFVDPEGVRVRG